MRAWTLAALVLSAGVLIAGWSLGGCGSSPAFTDTESPTTLPPTVTVSTTTSSTIVTVTDPSPSSTSAATANASQSDVAHLFGDLARALAPLAVYGLTELPSGASVPAQWWPVLTLHSPSDYHGPEVPNPQVSDSPPGTQAAEVLLKLGDGWLVILENLRGDLGDVTGSAVGTVAGRPATLYELNDGVLVQWSDQGAWYGVFGRGVSAEEVVRTALSLTVIEVGIDSGGG